MRTATFLARGQIDWWPENVFSGRCPCICRTLKLLSRLWLVVRDSVLISPPKKQRGNTLVYVCMCVCVWTPMYVLHVACVFLSECARGVCVCVCARLCV